MSLRKKTILIIGVTLTCLLGGMYILSSGILTNGISQIEQTDTAKDTRRALDTINKESSDLDRATHDWASWDDTYAFIEDKNPEFVASNIATENSWINNKLNLMMFVDSSGKVVYGGAFDLQNETMTTVPESTYALIKDHGDLLLSHPDLSVGVKGLIMLPEGPMLISSQPVLSSDRLGPSRGSLIWGRYLNASLIDRLSNLTQLPLSIQAIGDTAMPQDFQIAGQALSDGSETYVNPLSQDLIAGYSGINDVFGNPAILLRIDLPRDFYNQIHSTMRIYNISILIVGLIFGLSTMILLERWVLARIASVSSRVTDIGDREDHSSRLDVTGNDEISGLAVGINKMLSGLDHVRKELHKAKNELEHRVEERTAQLKQKVATLQTLTEIDREVTATVNSANVLGLACRYTANLLQAPKSLIIISGNPGGFHLGASFGTRSNGNRDSDLEQDFLEAAFDSQALAKQGTYAVNQLTADTAFFPHFFEREEIKSLIISPMIAEGKNLGAILALDTQRRQWTDDQTQILSLITAQVALALDQTRLFEQEQERRGELSSLYGLSKELVDTAPEQELILDIVTRQSVKTINATYAQIALKENEDMVIRAFNPIRVLKSSGLTGKLFPMSQLHFCSQSLDRSQPVIVTADDQKLSNEEHDLLFVNEARTVCLVPLKTSEKIYGILIMGEERQTKRETFSSEKLRLATSIADQTMSSLRRAELFGELESAYLQAVTALANAVGARDSYTANHGNSMQELAVIVGQELGLPPQKMEDLKYGALLHDVGKIGVPDAVLKKPAGLDACDWDTMRMHPEIGEKILDPIPRLAGAAKIVRHHHERFDGSGYPDGLAGEQIPIGARIINVVDSYEAIIDQRVYKDAHPSQEAIEELKRCSGTQFDPRIVEIFLAVLVNRAAA